MKKLIVGFCLFILISSQSLFALTRQEVSNVSLQIAQLLRQVSVYAKQGDAKNACASARKAIGLFATIDPQNDIQTDLERRAYSEAAISINAVSQSMQGVCY